MSSLPKFELVEAAAIAAAGAYEILGGEINEDVLIWEALQLVDSLSRPSPLGRKINPGELIVGYIDRFGIAGYMQLRDSVAGRINMQPNALDRAA